MEEVDAKLEVFLQALNRCCSEKSPTSRLEKIGLALRGAYMLGYLDGVYAALEKGVDNE